MKKILIILSVLLVLSSFLLIYKSKQEVGIVCPKCLINLPVKNIESKSLILPKVKTNSVKTISPNIPKDFLQLLKLKKK